MKTLVKISFLMVLAMPVYASEPLDIINATPSLTEPSIETATITPENGPPVSDGSADYVSDSVVNPIASSAAITPLSTAVNDSSLTQAALWSDATEAPLVAASNVTEEVPVSAPMSATDESSGAALANTTEEVSAPVNTAEEAAASTAPEVEASVPPANFEAVVQIPAWVERVESVCPWKSSTDEGYVRVVRTEYQSRNQLFLQWIRKGQSDHNTVVETSIIAELEEEYLVKIEMPAMMLNPRSCELNALASSVTDKQQYRFKILLREPGNYQLQVNKVLGTAEI